MGNAPPVEVRPRRADSGLVSACCLARKGNFRHGPPVPVDIAQDWKSLAREERYGKKVTWCPGRMLETRYELIESGDEWTEARKSQDVDLSAVALDTFERAPPARPGGQSAFAYPPGRTEDEEERRRREKELAGDEELARNLAAQLRLTSPVETMPDRASDPFGDDDRRLPRVGDRNPAAYRGEADADRAPGVEYHAMDSDTEDAFYAEPPKAAGYHQVLCNVLVSFFRNGALNSRA
ncbi:unnamed protein product [Symbiodinium microadriaticum]|nr:unnamed protein product [Symbiodinium microadriaticum]